MIYKCHTQRRFADDWYKITEVASFGEYLTAKYQAYNAPAYLDNDSCVKEIFTSNAYYYEENCPSYDCSSTLSPDKCAYYSPYNNTVELGEGCLEGETCAFNIYATEWSASISCDYQQITPRSRYPGEECLSNEQCLSLNCANDGKCAALGEGDSCIDA